MPINFLKHIKMPSPKEAGKYRRFVPEGMGKNTEGVFVFPCDDIDAKQLLFNDGYPALVFMPTRHSTAKIISGGVPLDLGPILLCFGTLKDTYIDLAGQSDHLVVARFSPESFHRLFGISPASFRSQPLCDFEDISGPQWNALIEEVYEADTVEGKVKKITTLWNGLQRDSRYPALLKSILDHIDRENGCVSVQELLAAAGQKINYKWLQRTFLSHIGLNPKQYISLQRFLHAYGDLSGNASRNLMETAIKNGYCDHNHLLKDFRQYTGRSPNIYFDLHQ